MKAIISVFNEKEYRMEDTYLTIAPNQEMNDVQEHRQFKNAPSKNSEAECKKDGIVEGLIIAKERIEKIANHNQYGNLSDNYYELALRDAIREIDAQIKIHQETR